MRENHDSKQQVRHFPAPVLLAVPVLLTALLASGCTAKPDAEPETTTKSEIFTDIARQAGIVHRHHQPILDAKLDNIMSWMASVGAGAAAGDYDGDGWIDLYVTNSKKGEANYLYHNDGADDGGLTFSEVAAGTVLADVNGEDGTSMDAVWGDYDNDGRVDLYLLRWGRDALFHNDGAGPDGRIVFTDVTAELFRDRQGRPGSEWANGNAAIFWDYDLDGRLDIYIGNYFKEVDLWNLEDTRVMHDDFERARNGGRNFLFHQEADGTFTEVAASLGLDDSGWTLAVGSADVDNNGWPDLYSADDFGPDQFFLNQGRDGDGGVTFVNATETAIGFDTKKGMNVDFGDFDNDGWLDAYITNITTAEYLQEGNMLWHNNGTDTAGVFSMTDVAVEAGTYDGGWGWGAKFFDPDNDGDLDIVAANGFISAGEGSYWYDLASWTVTGDDPTNSQNWPPINDRSFSGGERLRFFRNDSLGTFTEESRQVGLVSIDDSRGIVVADFDNDGDQDLYIANQDSAPHLYRNEQKSSHHYLMVALEADPSTGTNRDAIGTRVTLVLPEGGRRIRERDGGNGYAAQSDPRLHFGLGDAERISLLEVRWPDGGLQYEEDLAPDQLLVIRQDPSRYATQLRLDQTVARRWEGAENSQKPAPPEVDPDQLEGQLSAFEERLGGAPLDRDQASAYRYRAVTYGQYDRPIRFFEQLLARRNDRGIRVELALAYVDKIPSCGGLAAVVCKGTLARKGLDLLDPMIEKTPDSWLLHYTRGMNHLHWPRALRHSDDAAEDLGHCIKLQQRSGTVNPYYERIHIALGDAWTKAGEYDKARQAWRQGMADFPQGSKLVERLAISSDEALLDYVEEQRNLEQRVDTDLSFYSDELEF